MYIAINKFKVLSNRADDFEKVWKERQSYLSEISGFMRFWLLRSQPTADQVVFLSHSQWVNEQAFQGWRKSEQMAKVHAQGSSVGPMLSGHPEFQGYSLVLDQVAGHRTDYRSVFIDQKVETNFVRETDNQKQISQVNQKKNLPSINIGAFEGQLLMMWLKAINARVGVEVGGLGGYSASWLLRGLPHDGKLYSLELEKDRAELMRSHFSQDSRIQVLEGKAMDALEGKLSDLKDLDFVFIDADKRSYPNYVRWALPRLRKGGLIILDNSYVWGGMNYWRESWEHPEEGSWASFPKNAYLGMSESWDLLSNSPDFDALVLPTGEGMLVAIKK